MGLHSVADKNKTKLNQNLLALGRTVTVRIKDGLVETIRELYTGNSAGSADQLAVKWKLTRETL